LQCRFGGVFFFAMSGLPLPSGFFMLNVMHGFYKPICLTLLAVLGLACGHLSGTALQMYLRPQATVAATTGPSTVISSAKTTSADLNLILQNNIFDTSNRSTTATMTLGSVTAGNDDTSSVARADL
jgi:hypothetical protein